MVDVSRTTSTILVRRGIDGVRIQRVVGRQVQVLTTRSIVTSGGGFSGYEHLQPAAASSWTVNHLLGRRPAAVSVLSPGGVEVDAAVIHVTTNQLVVEFAQPYSGSVRVS